MTHTVSSSFGYLDNMWNAALKEGWCCQLEPELRSSLASLRFYWSAAVCCSQWGPASIISVKALRAAVRYLLFKPVCSQLPWGSGAVLTLFLFICVHVCSGVTSSSPLTPRHTPGFRVSRLFTDMNRLAASSSFLCRSSKRENFCSLAMWYGGMCKGANKTARVGLIKNNELRASSPFRRWQRLVVELLASFIWDPYFKSRRFTDNEIRRPADRRILSAQRKHCVH